MLTRKSAAEDKKKEGILHLLLVTKHEQSTKTKITLLWNNILYYIQLNKKKI